MQLKSFIIFLCFVITVSSLTGCSTKGNEQNYQTKEYNGIKFKIPAEWKDPDDEDEDRIQYFSRKSEDEYLMFYIYSYPKDKYKSKFLDLENKTYKSLFKLRKEEKLKQNMTLMTFEFDPASLPGAKAHTNIIKILLVVTKDHVLEVSMDMSQTFYKNNPDIIDYIFKSVKIQ